MNEESHIRVITGHVDFTDGFLRELGISEAAWRELGWTATHYDQATPAQRERLRNWHPDWDALEALEDER